MYKCRNIRVSIWILQDNCKLPSDIMSSLLTKVMPEDRRQVFRQEVMVPMVPHRTVMEARTVPLL